MKPLSKDFYMQDALTLSRELLGKVLVHETEDGIIKGRIVETEAYMGAIDPASHAYQNRKTARTSVMFEDGGIAYVYLIYGMYNCMNVVANKKDTAQACLIRALEPIEGIEIMKKNRKMDKLKNLCNGPGKLCMALGITKAQHGADLITSPLYLEEPENPEPFEVITSKRINIDYAGEAKDYPWRFLIKDSPYISVKP